MQGLGGAAPGLRLFFLIFGFFCLPELLDQSGPLLRWGFGDGRNGLLCGLDVAGQDFLFDAWRNFFSGVYTFGKMLCTSYITTAEIIFPSNAFSSTFRFIGVLILNTPTFV